MISCIKNCADTPKATNLIQKPDDSPKKNKKTKEFPQKKKKIIKQTNTQKNIHRLIWNGWVYKYRKQLIIIIRTYIDGYVNVIGSIQMEQNAPRNSYYQCLVTTNNQKEKNISCKQHFIPIWFSRYLSVCVRSLIVFAMTTTKTKCPEQHNSYTL